MTRNQRPLRSLVDRIIGVGEETTLQNSHTKSRFFQKYILKILHLMVDNSKRLNDRNISQKILLIYSTYYPYLMVFKSQRM